MLKTKLSFVSFSCSTPGSEGDSSHRVAHMTFDLPIMPEMTPIARVLVYYVREDRETVADSKEIRMDKCVQNKVLIGVILTYYY